MAKVRNIGSADGSIIAAIIVAHMSSTNTKSALLQPVMAGISSISAPMSMFSMPQARYAT